jgi:hypothetical protein
LKNLGLPFLNASGLCFCQTAPKDSPTDPSTGKFIMTKNMGKQDRNLRLAAAGLLILAGIFTNTWWLTLLGLVPLATSASGFCPAYVPFKIDTRKQDER